MKVKLCWLPVQPGALDYRPPPCATQLPSAQKAAVDAYVQRWGPLLQGELEEERKLVRERLEAWPDYRLQNEGLMLKGLLARPQGSFFGRNVVLVSMPGGPMPFTRFKAGDLVTLSRGHPLQDRCWEASVLDKSWKEIRLVMDAIPDRVTDNTWRLDSGVDMSMYVRACAALKSLYKSPSSIFPADDDDEGPPVMPFFAYEELNRRHVAKHQAASAASFKRKGKRARQAQQEQEAEDDLPPGTGILDVLLAEGGAAQAAQPSGLMPAQAIAWARQQLLQEQQRQGPAGGGGARSGGGSSGDGRGHQQQHEQHQQHHQQHERPQRGDDRARGSHQQYDRQWSGELQQQQHSWNYQQQAGPSWQQHGGQWQGQMEEVDKQWRQQQQAGPSWQQHGRQQGTPNQHYDRQQYGGQPQQQYNQQGYNQPHYNQQQQYNQQQGYNQQGYNQQQYNQQYNQQQGYNQQGYNQQHNQQHNRQGSDSGRGGPSQRPGSSSHRGVASSSLDAVGRTVVAAQVAALEDDSLGLNRSQAAAVAQSILNRVTLVHGPPGTGKTSTIIRFLSLLLSKMQLTEPVLVCAQSNVAVDNLLEGLVNQGIRALRMGEPVKVRPELRNATLQARLMNHPMQTAAQELSEEVFHIKSQLPGLSGKDRGLAHRDLARAGQQLKEVKSEMTNSVLKNAQVVCATCVGSGSDMLASCVFPVVVLDEGSQATEPECLIPITKGARHVVLVGDHHQLPPVVKSQQSQQSGLNCSLFERLLVGGAPAALLQVQYRMHPALSFFPNHEFYAGDLVDGVTAAQRPAPAGVPWPTPAPFMVVDVQGAEVSTAGGSKSNALEAGVCVRLVAALLRGGLDKTEIGLVTPYLAQVQLLTHQVQLILNKTAQDQQRAQWQWRHDQQPASPPGAAAPGRAPWDDDGAAEGVLEVKSVDGYQGREKEVIVFSAVRCNAQGQVGFLDDWRRLNVAITRARRGLILVGHIPTLCQDPHWRALMEHAQQAGYVTQLAQLRLPGEEAAGPSGTAHHPSH